MIDLSLFQNAETKEFAKAEWEKAIVQFSLALK